MTALPAHFPSTHPPELHLRAEPLPQSEIPNPQSEVLSDCQSSPLRVPSSALSSIPHSELRTPNSSSPSPHPTSAIPHPTFLSDLSSPSLSLHQVAEKHNISLHELTAWMLRPDVAEQLNAIESVGARRARLVCSTSLTEVAGALLSQLRSAQADAPPTDNSIHSFSLRLRARESTRKAAALFLRIARFDPTCKTPSPRPTKEHAVNATKNSAPAEATSLREGGGEGGGEGVGEGVGGREHSALSTNAHPANSHLATVFSEIPSMMGTRAEGARNIALQTPANHQSQDPAPSSPNGLIDSSRGWSESFERHPRSTPHNLPHAESVPHPLPTDGPADGPTDGMDETPDISDFISNLRATDPALFQNLSDEETQALVIEAVAHITTPLATEQIASLPDETIFSLILNHLRSTHSPGP